MHGYEPNTISRCSVSKNHVGIASVILHPSRSGDNNIWEWPFHRLIGFISIQAS